MFLQVLILFLWQWVFPAFCMESRAVATSSTHDTRPVVDRKLGISQVRRTVPCPQAPHQARSPRENDMISLPLPQKRGQVAVSEESSQVWGVQLWNRSHSWRNCPSRNVSTWWGPCS